MEMDAEALAILTNIRDNLIRSFKNLQQANWMRELAVSKISCMIDSADKSERKGK